MGVCSTSTHIPESIYVPGYNIKDVSKVNANAIE